MELILSVNNVCGNGTVDTYQCKHIDQNTNTRCTYTVVIGSEKGHNIGDFVIEKEPTCTEAGIKYKPCTNDGCEYKTEYKDIPPLDHDYQKDSNRSYAPTCTKDGLEAKTCSRCGKHEDTIIDALKHDFGDPVHTDYTCTTSSIDTYTCKRNNCGFSYDVNNADCPGHDYSGDYEVTEKANCTENGKREKHCVRVNGGKLCDELLGTLVINAREHDFSDWETTKDPTCLESGLSERYCKNTTATDEYEACTKTESKPIKALGHGLLPSDEGYNSAADNDKMQLVSSKKNNCGNGTVDTYQCKHIDKNTNTRCTYTVVIGEAKDHKLGDYVVSLEPTCTEKGYKHKECQNDDCDYRTKDEEIPATGHGLLPSDEGYNSAADNDKMELISSKKNNCGNGTVDTYQCKHIDKNTNTRCTYTVVIGEAKDHKLGDYVVSLEPTCTEKGYKHKECQNDDCDYRTKDEEIPATGHGLLPSDEGYNSAADNDKMELISSKKNNCGNGTVDTYQCKHIDKNTNTRCTYTVVIGEAKDHKLGDYVVSLEPTCTEKGYKHKECQNDDCDYRTKDEEISATGHGLLPSDEGYNSAADNDKMQLISYEKNNCGNGTVDTYQCKHIDKNTNTRCTYTVVIGEAKDHKLGDYVVSLEPTCTEKGYKHKECQNDGCDYRTKDEEIPALEHAANNKWTVTKKPTCAEKGEEQCKCVRHDDGVTCKKVFTREIAIDEDAHNWDDGVIKPASTCKTHGTKTYTCKNDSSHTRTEEVALDPDNHVGKTYLKDNKEAKCTEDGYTGDVYCADCEALLTKGQTINAIGHKYGDWEITIEPTYDSVGEKQQICQNDESHKNKDIVPVLTRPSEDNENVTTDKTVDYDSLTGEAVIRLLASSNGKKITVNSRIPLDIVLVLDQSGSMEGDLNKKLKEAVESFNKSIYNDAVESGLDHRIAMVGFARGLVTDGRESYLNTGILTTGSKYIKYGSLSNEAYKNALVSVNADNSLNPILTTATENIKAEGATATDLGLDMACKIFSQYKEDEEDESRKRIVVLMSDGVPTYSNASEKQDVNDATYNANLNADLLKGTYKADIYSVGLLSALADDVKRGDEYITYGKQYGKNFLENIASKDDSNAPLYYDCSESSELISSFSKIAKESVTVKTDFTDVTLVDTVSKAFTLTSKQEQKLRADAIEKLGVSNSDITVTRYADGTTEVKIQHITPNKVESGNDVKFVVDFSFSVTANENALVADSYVTNTDNAGVIVGVKDVYENNFTAPSDNVEEADGVVYFNINGITYHVLRVHAGDKVEQPEINLEGGYTFSGWDIPDEITFDGGKYTIDATLTQDEYTVTWVTDGETATEKYHFGDIITVPNVKKNANGDAFDSWDKEVPTTMPAEDLTFTASYSKHEHKWVTSTTTSDKDVTAFSNVYCELCGESPDKTLSYTLTGTFGKIEYTYDLKLVDAKNIKVNVDGSITVSLPIPESMKYAKQVKIYREEADGTLTDLNGTKNRSGSYITFTTDHFSKYILKAIYECDESGKHVDKNCDKNCDICGVEYPELGHKYASLVIAPTCTEGGYTVHTCSVCGNSYTDNKVSALGHNDSNGDGKCDNCGDTLQDIANNCGHLCHSTNGFVQFIWKIVRFFCKLFGTNKVCSCGVKHW